MDDRVRAFLEKHHGAVVATLKDDGSPHVARVAVALMGAVLWSSGTQDRVRTGHLRRDSRATLCVLDGSNPYAWMGIESHVRILDGADAPELNVRLFRVMQNRPSGPLSWFGAELDEDAFRARMVEEGRLIFRHFGHG